MISDVPFHLPDTMYEAYTWILEDGHPASQTPLIADTPNSPERPTSDPGSPPQRLNINGFTYVRADTSAERASAGATFPETVEQLRHWRSEWLPRIEALAHRLEAFDPTYVESGTWERVLAAQQTEFQQIFRGVHEASVGKSRLVSEHFIEAFVECYGTEREGDALALLQGFPNLSLSRATGLWQASRLLRRIDTHGGIPERLDRVSAATPEGRAFHEWFARLLREFGHTTNTRMQDFPTWAEDASIPFTMVRGYASQEDGRSPATAAEGQRTKRQQLEEKLRTEAQVRPQAASLLPLMKMAQELLPNLEDHNLLADQRMFAASRARWLAIGRHLQEREAISSRDEVFYYRLKELVSTLGGDESVPRDGLAERRSLQAVYRTSPPPRVLGKSLPGSGHPLPSEGSEGHVLRGTPASLGTYRGRARIIHGLSEAGRLVEGDILVCRSTTPPWTPYFGLVGALVTDVGSVLSHSAIVAREFGIPVVVGTMSAVVQIPDGATITVDGSAGLVVIEPNG